MVSASDPCVERYRALRNLKLVGAELGMPWQTVYSRLKRAGEPVVGDKARYGSETDRLAARAERWFQNMVPSAVDQNAKGFQAKVDFYVGGLGIDVKVSRARVSKRGVRQWCWSVKRQQAIADFMVCIALTGNGEALSVHRVVLLPGELVRTYQTIRASAVGEEFRGKWTDYVVSPADLRAFFERECAA